MHVSYVYALGVFGSSALFSFVVCLRSNGQWRVPFRVSCTVCRAARWAVQGAGSLPATAEICQWRRHMPCMRRGDIAHASPNTLFLVFTASCEGSHFRVCEHSSVISPKLWKFTVEHVQRLQIHRCVGGASTPRYVLPGACRTSGLLYQVAEP